MENNERASIVIWMVKISVWLIQTCESEFLQKHNHAPSEELSGIRSNTKISPLLEFLIFSGRCLGWR